MKLSKLEEAKHLADKRDALGSFMEAARRRPNRLIRAGYWDNVEFTISPTEVESICWQAQAEINKIEAELKLLGVEIDVGPNQVPADEDEEEMA